MGHRFRRALLALLSAAALAACAPGPLSVEGASLDLEPGDVQADPEAAQGKTIVWGGKIVSSKNLAERTRLEIVAYPIRARAQRPQTDQKPLGRFRAYEPGYLETAEYAPGREVTVRGVITGTEEDPIDEVTYTYPTIEAEAIKLWPPRRELRREEPRLYFRFGVMRRF